MKKYVIVGKNKLEGKIRAGGAKNVALKVIIAACLTEEVVTIENIPLISDVFVMLELVREIGGSYTISDHSVTIHVPQITNTSISLEAGAKTKTSSMFLAPLLARTKKAKIPNPGGCRIGARPIDRHIQGLEKMGAVIGYHSEDGYFTASTEGLKGCEYEFDKNTHTGTETLIIAAATAIGTTKILNAAEEPEIDDLIGFLNSMGAKIRREAGRKIVIVGVEKLHGTTYSIMSDSNEIVTWAILSALSGGGITITHVSPEPLAIFLQQFRAAGGDLEQTDDSFRFYNTSNFKPVNITTGIHPGFMTDWQGPWAVLATQSDGISIIHETIYENRFGYVSELKKMGAKIKFFNPKVDNPVAVYNFNWDNNTNSTKQAIEITGPNNLHDAVVVVSDLRAGATLVLAALIAKGKTIIYGVEQIERGYEDFPRKLASLGADIEVIEEKV